MILSLISFVLIPLTKLMELLSGLLGTTARANINDKEFEDGCETPSRHLQDLQTYLFQHCHDTTHITRDPEDAEEERSPPESLDERQRRSEEELMRFEDTQSVMEDDTATGTGHECSSEQTEGSKEVMEVSVVPTEVDVCPRDCAALVNFIQDLQEVPPEDSTPSEREPDRADVISVSLHLTAELHTRDERTHTPADADTSHIREDDEEDAHPSACCSEILLGLDADAESKASIVSSRPVFDLRSLLADSDCVQTPAEPVGWHFPTGLGLSDVCFCPYLQFPPVSYYPVFQHNDNIEVTWRIWEDLSEAGDEPRADVFEFSVMSYNILSQDLLEAHPDLYTHCLEEVLMWEYRLHLLLKELHIWMPDILCLQEVQENHFEEQMCPVLSEMGYTCIYKRRTGIRTDGCAVCYQSRRFTQLSVNLLEFYRSHCALLDRDNVGIVLLLQPITELEALRPICVANTHLLFNPKRGDVKLAQLAIVLAEIDRMMEKCKGDGRSCEVILCGDFNALPNTPLLKFITSGQLYYHGLSDWMVSGQVDLSSKFYQKRLLLPLLPESLGIDDNCQYVAYSRFRTSGSEKLQYSPDFLRQLRFCQASCVRPPDLDFIPGVTDNTPVPEEIQMFSSMFRHTLFHSLNLTSAYHHIHPITHNCVLTTLNSEGGAMVDYIFYGAHTKEKCGGLKLLGRLSLLCEADLLSLKGLPNETFPSDHLSLLAKFQLS